MIQKLKQFFENHLLSGGSGQDDPEQAIRLAVAVLLFEVAESDYQQLPEERDALISIVQAHFQLTADEAEQLLELAKVEHADSTDYFQFTQLINRHYSASQKVHLIEGLWQVAFADQKLHRYEEHVIRRLAELLYVSHTDFIAAKLRVSNQ